MTIAELTEGLPIQLVRGSVSTVIEEIVEDSRLARPGCLFAARTGASTDGHGHIDQAVARGAVAVLVETNASVPDGVTVLATERVAALLGQLAERTHGTPSRALTLIGVTGTNGKTTVCHLIHQVLTHVGLGTGLLSTVQVDAGHGSRPAQMTTPPAPQLSRQLAQMTANGCIAAVLEVSSHALHQGRTAGLRFDVGVFTNLSGDHLDYHGTTAAYAEAKARLFRDLAGDGLAVVNIDDPAAATMIEDCAAPVLTCSLTSPDADCFARIGHQTISFVQAHLVGPWGALEVRLPLTGRHNVANALQAAAVVASLGVDGASLRSALEQAIAPPGRLEPVTDAGCGFTVLVDYAHTDDALANVLGALRPLVRQDGRLRVVFGCGGDRDRSKRPRMGAVAAELADELIITSDNPRTEEPMSIIDDIVAGVPAPDRARTIAVAAREQAIDLAISRAAPGDVVLIAGKGHEPYQIVGIEKRPFDDRRLAAQALGRHA